MKTYYFVLFDSHSRALLKICDTENSMLFALDYFVF